MSRSSLRSASSLFNRLTSSSSGFNQPFPGNECSLSSIYWFFHFRRTFSWISKSWAASDTFLPPSTMRRTVSTLNSLSNFLLPSDRTHLLVLYYNTQAFRCVHYFGGKIKWSMNGPGKKNGLLVISGEPGSGKSQLALDLLAQLASTGVCFIFFDLKGELEDDPNNQQ